MTDYEKIMDGFSKILKIELRPICLRIDSLEEKMDREFAALREEMNAKFADVYKEIASLREDMTSLREEMNAKFADVYKEIASLREEMDTRFADVYKEIASLREEMNMEFAAVRKEMDVVYSEVLELKKISYNGKIQDNLLERVCKLEMVTGIA